MCRARTSMHSVCIRSTQDANLLAQPHLAHVCDLTLLQDWAAKIKAGRLSKGERLGVTNHDEIEYPPFRRNFYIEVSLHSSRSSCRPAADMMLQHQLLCCTCRRIPL